MPIVHCQGHEFFTVHKVGVPDPIAWWCYHCDLKVNRESAAEYLTGKKA